MCPLFKSVFFRVNAASCNASFRWYMTGCSSTKRRTGMVFIVAAGGLMEMRVRGLRRHFSFVSDCSLASKFIDLGISIIPSIPPPDFFRFRVLREGGDCLVGVLG